MAIQPILLHPHAVLREVTTPVAEVNGTVFQLCQNLITTMHAAPGVGLAAPQIGVLQRVAVVHCEVTGAPGNRSYIKGTKPICLINPKLLWHSEDAAEMEEGCLSLPALYAPVVRPKHIRVQYLDEHGNEHTLEPQEGLMTAAILHEMDHLDGVLFTDHLSRLRRERVLKRYTKLLPGLVNGGLDYPFTQE